MTHTTLWLLHVGATLAMVGVIWVIQLVHYPLFARVGEAGWLGYHADHMRLISYIVMPLMLVEIGTAMYFLTTPPTSAVGPAVFWVGAALVGVAWLTTAVWSVPYHGALGSGLDPDGVRALVLTNWPRTLAWSARGVLVLWVTGAMLHASAPAA